MHRGKSTIAEELVRNAVQGSYDPRKAQHKAYARRKYAKYQGMKIVEHAQLKAVVDARLFDDQSPELIAGHIARHEKDIPSISKNAIYRYLASVYGRRLEAHRLLRGKRRKRRRGMRRTLSDRTFIDKRSAYINARKKIGDCEADFIVSGKSGRGILLTLCDRRSRMTFLARILPVTIRNVHRAFLRIKTRFPEMKTITTDNDILFAQHERLAELLNVRIFFCRPYHAWEKGTIEHVNGVIRRDIPKGSDLSHTTEYSLRKLEDKLNRRPMKILGFRSPAMMLAAYRKRTRKQKRPPC